MISHLEYRPTCRPTVNARELGGPHGKLGPDNTWLNEFGVFLLKLYCNNTSTAYGNDFGKLFKNVLLQ